MIDESDVARAANFSAETCKQLHDVVALVSDPGIKLAIQQLYMLGFANGAVYSANHLLKMFP